MAVDPQDLDLSLATQFAGWAMLEEVTRRLRRDGFDDTRFADGVLFQHLVEGPCRITDLGGRMGVTQQAASKAVSDLERRGYVGRHADPWDARSRVVVLTERGQAVVRAARRHRTELDAELAEHLGARRTEQARRVLLEVVDHLGAEPALRSRRVRPPV